jgi:hypothetical protein
MLSLLLQALRYRSTGYKNKTVRHSRSLQPSPQLRVETLEERTLLSVGPRFDVNSKLHLDQDQADVACAPTRSGGCVVVWRDQFSATDTDIYAQIFDNAGNKIGRQIRVAASPSEESEPAVAVDAQGNFVIVWTVASITNSEIKAQRFSARGSTNGGSISVATTWNSHFVHDPSVAMDSSGNFVVSYTRDNPYAWSRTDRDVWARRYDSNGAALGYVSVAHSGLDEHNAEVARSPDGRFSIVYQIDQLASGGRINSDIRLYRYSSDAAVLANHRIASTSVNEHDPEVAMNRNGETIVAYEYQYSTVYRGVYARKVSSDGVMGGVIFVDNTRFSTPSSPTVAMDANGNFVVAYMSNRIFGGSPDNIIFEPPYAVTFLTVAEMNADGSLHKRYLLSGGGTNPAIALNDGGDYFLAYQAWTQFDSPENEIFGRHGVLLQPQPAESIVGEHRDGTIVV